MKQIARERFETAWLSNPEIFSVHELPDCSDHAFYATMAEADADASSLVKSLDGAWKAHFAMNPSEAPDTLLTSAALDETLREIQVPCEFQMEAPEWDPPHYVNTQYPWDGHEALQAPQVSEVYNPTVTCIRHFSLSLPQVQQRTVLHLAGVEAAVLVYVNGHEVGYAEDSFTPHRFDLTPYVHVGENRLALRVFKRCTGSWMEDQDFWRFSGIHRSVSLHFYPETHLYDLRVRTPLTDNYTRATLETRLRVMGASLGKAKLTLTDKAGKTLWTAEKPLTALESYVSAEIPGVKLWSAEEPNLYTLTVVLTNAQGQVTEVCRTKVGFRQFEMKDKIMCLNGKRIVFHGVNRHEFDCDRGRVMTHDLLMRDIRDMKAMNINAVRTCHYPDNNLWYDLCDQYGIYVVAEANIESHGMGYGEETLAKREDYRKAHMERNQRNVQRSFNHPSVIFWSLGNEAGYGANFEAAYDWIKAEDPSRAVQYEQAGTSEFTDIFCPMYYGYDGCKKYSEDDSMTKPLIQCEYAHAMGNSQGGFKEYWDLVRKYSKFQGGFIWDFVDQSVRWTGKNGKMIYAYGGDFNRFDASDGNFCDNGLISPDRVPNPHMYEVGRIYQDIWTTPADLKNGEINVFNEYFFRDLSAYYMEWEVLKGGKVIRTGRVDNLNVAPQQTAKIKLDLGKTCQCTEWLLNVSYKLKNREGLLSAGHVVAKDQLTLNPYQAPSMELKNCEQSNIEMTAPQVQDNDWNYLIVSGDAFRVEINKHNGYLTKYEVNGRDMIKDGEALKPNFWRAPVDNDYGANLQRKYIAWKNPEIKLTSFKQRTENNLVIVESAYDMPGVSAKLNLVYVINNAGAVKVTQKLTADKNAKVSNMFRFGLQMPMPRSFETVEYYGRGPVENYIDRNHCADLGIYRQSVAEQFYPYIRPQENGTKTDIRWWKMLDQSGNGIKIVAAAPFSASALHYTIESLDEGWSKEQGHSQEVDEADLTNLCIDKVQAGLGCEDSWGRIARPEYLVPYADYEFTFILFPVCHSIGIE